MDTTKTITHLSLCAGYGGIDLGLRSVLPRLRSCCYVEIEAFPIANLVAKMQEGWLDAAPIWTNLKTFDARPFRGKVDILSGGFPCQPFSHAGQRKGTEDPRHLFPEIERIIRECEPRMLFLENVEGIISSKYGGTEQSVLHYVLGRLESMGYRAEAGLFSAEECLYPHRRKRVFIAGLRNTYYSSKPTLSKHDETSGLPKHRELADTKNFGHSGGSARTGREGSEGECNNGDEVRCETEHVCELGDTQHDGPLTTGNIGKLQGEPNGSEESEQQSEGSGIRELADTRCDKCGGWSTVGGEQESNGRETSQGQAGREGRQDQAGQRSVSEFCNEGSETRDLDDTCCEGLEGITSKAERPMHTNGGETSFPSRPGEPQHYWEAPRTIGDEEIVTAMGGSDYGSADGNILRNQRIDSLRALGNGVVPATAARAFVTLMDRLGGGAL